MRAAKIGLLLVILLFGATVETAWQVREQIGLGPVGCHVMGDRFYGPSFTFETTERHAVPAGAPVEVDNAFGSVRVTSGAPGEAQVRLRKVVFRPTDAEAHAFADRVQLTMRDEAGRVRVGTNREALERDRPDGRAVGFETHLEIAIPPDSALVVRNEHGSVEVTDVAQADLTASFDDVEAERIRGDLKADVRHGGALARQVKGALTLVARHGSVHVEDVTGTVSVDVEHGGAQIARVGPTTARTAYGDLKIDGVAGDLEAHAEHGGVEAAQVAGRATLSSSFDGVVVRKVDGDARLTAEHGGIEAEDVQGALTAEASFDDVQLTRIGRDVEVTVDHGGLEAKDLAGGARVKSNGDDVRLEDFGAAVDVEVERGSVELTPAGPIAHAMTVRAQHGGITLHVPAGSRLDLDAAAQPGDLSIDLPEWSAERTEKSRTVGRVGGGGVPVKLTAENGDVEVLASAAPVAESSPAAPSPASSPAKR